MMVITQSADEEVQDRRAGRVRSRPNEEHIRPAVEQRPTPRAGQVRSRVVSSLTTIFTIHTHHRPHIDTDTTNNHFKILYNSIIM